MSGLTGLTDGGGVKLTSDVLPGFSGLTTVSGPTGIGSGSTVIGTNQQAPLQEQQAPVQDQQAPDRV